MHNSRMLECDLTDAQFNALLKLFACDVQCLAGEEVVALRELLNDEAALRGYRNWIEAFNGRQS